MKKLLKYIGILFVILLIANTAIQKFKQFREGKRVKSVKVRLETIELSEFTEIINASGVIDPKTKINISAKVSAQIKKMPVKERQKVTVGKNPCAGILGRRI